MKIFLLILQKQGIFLSLHFRMILAAVCTAKYGQKSPRGQSLYVVILCDALKLVKCYRRTCTEGTVELILTIICFNHLIKAFDL